MTETEPGESGSLTPTLLWALAALFLCCALTLGTAIFLGPEDPGIEAARGDRLVISSVEPGSPAARAGLARGDVLVTWDGEPLGPGLRRLLLRSWTGVHRLELERAGVRQVVEVPLGRNGLSHWLTAWGFKKILGLLIGLANLLLGCAVVRLRPRERAAQAGALFLLMWGVTSLTTFGAFQVWGGVYVLRQLPLPLGVLTVAAYVFAGGGSSQAMVTWVCLFPRPLFRGRLPYLAIWAPAVVPWFWIGPQQMALAFPELVAGRVVPRVALLPVFVLRFAYVLAVPVLLFVAYARTADVSQRRRVRVVLVGLGLMALGLVGATLPGLPRLLGTTFAFLYSDSSVFPLLFLLLTLAGPACIAYAIVRHRLFDVRVIVRRGIQYAAARGLLLSLAPVCGALFVADLLLHGDQPLGTVLARRGWGYLALGALGYLLHTRRDRWLTALDRTFFRERYDARRLLREVVDEVRRAVGLEEAAQRVTAKVTEALHPEQVVLLVRRPGEATFAPLAASGTSAGATTVALPAQGKLVGLLRLLDKPVDLQPTGPGGVLRELPADETAPLRGSRLEWLFPVTLGEGRTEVVLAVGPKRSEEPYSAEDQDLLAAVAGSLSMLVERTTAGGPQQATVALASTPAVPELVAKRYRLGAALGHGGMGAVYEAVDTTLDRRVAVKLIRGELAASPEARERFRREAKAAAGFSHPHVVTVHDFGVGEDGRAYIVMERLEGETLREMLRREPRLSVERAVEILGAVGRAVDEGHQRQLVHRDLKPENIYLARVAEAVVPKVLDFGIAKSLGSGDTPTATAATAPGAVIGTPLYMPPEQLRGGQAEPSWDLWSLAVVAYEMLSGRLPFPPLVTPAGLDAALQGRVAPLGPELGDVGLRLDAVFGVLFCPDPRARPRSAREMTERVGACASAPGPAPSQVDS